MRLSVDFVDVYYSHRVLSRSHGIGFARAVAQLREEGLVRHAGLSEVSAAWLRAAHQEGGPVGCIQQEWSLLTRGIEEELLPVCKELGIGIIAYSPLARNLLAAPSERPTDQRRQGIPRFSAKNFEQNRRCVAEPPVDRGHLTCTVVIAAWGWPRAHPCACTILARSPSRFSLRIAAVT